MSVRLKALMERALPEKLYFYAIKIITKVSELVIELIINNIYQFVNAGNKQLYTKSLVLFLKFLLFFKWFHLQVLIHRSFILTSDF